jgi:hypothetical protein
MMLERMILSEKSATFRDHAGRPEIKEFDINSHYGVGSIER